MRILVIAEHDNAVLGAATLNAVTAATRIGGAPPAAIDVLVAGVAMTVLAVADRDPVARR